MPTVPAMNYVSPSADVQLFLDELCAVLQSPTFNLATDLDILPKKKNESPTDLFTTANTMLELDFDKEDVRNQLLDLKVHDYFETIADNKDSTFPPFFAFVKNIAHRNVYIKVKIRDRTKGKVFCVSFHFARYPVANFPYSI